jgi:putative two-component system response regulator
MMSRTGEGRKSPLLAVAILAPLEENPAHLTSAGVGNRVDAVANQLSELRGELNTNLTSPRPDTVVFLEGALNRLRAIPFATDPHARIDCLLSISQQFYHQGQSVFSAVEPAALAVMLAEQVNDKRLQRRALNLQGIILNATSNPGDAIRSFVAALDIAQTLGDEELQAGTWNNLGGAFYEAALYSDASESFARAADLALGMQKLRSTRGQALANGALCCLHTGEYEEGIERLKDSLSLLPPPTTPTEMLNRVLAEGTYTRLLLAVGKVRAAAERVHIAKEYAANAKSVRADISAACSEGLVEVYSGLADVGLSRGMAALERARVIKPSLRETLLALVQAHDKAGRPDRALALHRELTLHVRKAQQENIVRHQELHLKQLESQEGQFPGWLLEEKDAELRLKIAAQSVGARQGDLLEQMAFTAEMRDDPSGEHCYRVARLAAFLARDSGETEEVCGTIELAARLHDIGKVAIPDTIMQKATPLTDGERQILQTHATTGAELLSKAKMSYSSMAEEIARHHHERWDGNGYPDGISGSAIPLAARIVAVCDAYDALIHEKAYRRAFSSDEAITEIMRGRELQFDPAIVDVFVPLIQRLREEHEDLDGFLGEAAKNTSLNIARQKIAESLAKPIDGAGSADGPGRSPRPQRSRRMH